MFILAVNDTISLLYCWQSHIQSNLFLLCIICRAPEAVETWWSWRGWNGGKIVFGSLWDDNLPGHYICVPKSMWLCALEGVWRAHALGRASAPCTCSSDTLPVHMLFGTQTEWPGILSSHRLSNTLFLFFLTHPIIPHYAASYFT